MEIDRAVVVECSKVLCNDIRNFNFALERLQEGSSGHKSIKSQKKKLTDLLHLVENELSADNDATPVHCDIKLCQCGKEPKMVIVQAKAEGVPEITELRCDCGITTGTKPSAAECLNAWNLMDFKTGPAH